MYLFEHSKNLRQSSVVYQLHKTLKDELSKKIPEFSN